MSRLGVQDLPRSLGGLCFHKSCIIPKSYSSLKFHPQEHTKKRKTQTFGIFGVKDPHAGALLFSTPSNRILDIFGIL